MRELISEHHSSLLPTNHENDFHAKIIHDMIAEKPMGEILPEHSHESHHDKEVREIFPDTKVIHSIIEDIPHEKKERDLITDHQEKEMMAEHHDKPFSEIITAQHKNPLDDIVKSFSEIITAQHEKPIDL